MQSCYRHFLHFGFVYFMLYLLWSVTNTLHFWLHELIWYPYQNQWGQHISTNNRSFEKSVGSNHSIPIAQQNSNNVKWYTITWCCQIVALNTSVAELEQTVFFFFHDWQHLHGFGRSILISFLYCMFSEERNSSAWRGSAGWKATRVQAAIVCFFGVLCCWKLFWGPSAWWKRIAISCGFSWPLIHFPTLSFYSLNLSSLFLFFVSTFGDGCYIVRGVVIYWYFNS